MKKLALFLAIMASVAALIYYAIFFISPNYPAKISYKPFSFFRNDPTLNIVIGGDVMFDRHIRAYGEKNGYDSLFSDIAQLLQKADIAVVNLEGPISSNSSKTLLPNGRFAEDLIFTFAPKTSETLARAGITLVSLANNHTDNFGRSGLDETKQLLEKVGVEWFGDPANIAGTEKIQCGRNHFVFKMSTSSDNFCVAFVGYHEFQLGIDRVLADVRRLSDLGYPVIVMPHWGDEYGTTSLPRVRQKAMLFIEAGAVAILGSHPHVVEETERINNVPVIYSLGNLIFDQYFSPDVMKGQIAEITLEKHKTGVRVKQILLHTISNSSKTGPKIVGQAIEF